MRRSAPLVLGLVVALLAGCGQSNPKLIPQSNADALNQTADAIQAACSQHDTSEARKQAKLAANEIAELPRTVDADLRDNLDAWIEQIRKRISDDCKAEETPTPSPAETATEAPTESPTQAPTETPTKAPTETPTQAPTDTPTEAPTEAPTQAPTEAPTTTPVP
jgi:outer membrane biosynthesis protein TonB